MNMKLFVVLALVAIINLTTSDVLPNSTAVNATLPAVPMNESSPFNQTVTNQTVANASVSASAAPSQEIRRRLVRQVADLPANNIAAPSTPAVASVPSPVPVGAIEDPAANKTGAEHKLMRRDVSQAAGPNTPVPTAPVPTAGNSSHPVNGTSTK